MQVKHYRVSLIRRTSQEQCIKCKIFEDSLQLFYYHLMDTFNTSDLTIPFIRDEQNKYYSVGNILEQNKFQVPQKQTIKKQKRIYRSNNSGDNLKVKKPLEEGMRIGHWSKQEKKRYHWFLQIYHTHFQNKQLRRMDKIFKTMADFIGSRAADQCRSHHQKMQKKYKTFYNIIFNLRSQHYESIDSLSFVRELELQNIVYQQGLINEQYLLKHLQVNQTQQNDLASPSLLMNQNSISLQKNSPKQQYQKNMMQNPLNFFNQLSDQFLI